MTENKLWAGASDIFTDYEGTVTDAKFENGQFGYQMKLTFDEIDGREDPVFEYYSIPDSWESTDGGETISRVDGKDAHQNPLKKSNAWQRFVMAAAKLNGVYEAVGDDAPLTASAWIGCRFRMEAVPGKSYKDRDTGEAKVAKDKNYPVEFLGKDSSTTTNSGQPASGNGTGSVNSLSVLHDLSDPVAQAKIQELAKSLPYPAWFQASFKVINATGQPVEELSDLIAAMGQRALYEGLGGKG